jgi:[ribosomal protein S5]-alanine N-acetyltransferase
VEAVSGEPVGRVGLLLRPRLDLGPTGSARLNEPPGAVELRFRAQPAAAGIGYWLTPAARGRGLATRAVGLLSRWGLRDGGLERVEAPVEPENRASVGVVERAGFVREGCLRRYLELDGRAADALVYALIPGDLG